MNNYCFKCHQSYPDDFDNCPHCDHIEGEVQDQAEAELMNDTLQDENDEELEVNLYQ